MAFFQYLGYRFGPAFEEHNSRCVVVGDRTYVRLLAERFFQRFSPKPVADAGKTTEAIVCIAMNRRAAVDAVVNRAIDAALSVRTRDAGRRYQRGCQDLDGHPWEVLHLEAVRPPARRRADPGARLNAPR